MDDFGISPVATPGAVAIVRDGCSIRVTQDLSLVSLAARRQPDAVKALGEALGGELPVVGKSATLDGDSSRGLVTTNGLFVQLAWDRPNLPLRLPNW